MPFFLLRVRIINFILYYTFYLNPLYTYKCIFIIIYFKCCNEQDMSTLNQKTSIIPSAENGGLHNDKIAILDAGSQYGKVRKILNILNFINTMISC